MEHNRVMKAGKVAATALVLLGIAAGAARQARGETVDRIVAVVGGAALSGAAGGGANFAGSGAVAGARVRVITWSGAYEEASYQAFRKNEEPPQWKATDPLNSPAFREVLQKLIDQALLAQGLERSPFAPTGGADIQEQIDLLEKKFPDAEAFRGALARYRLTEEKLAEHLTRESLLLAYVDSTLRPQAHVTGAQIEEYFQNTLLPDFRLQSGMEPSPPLEAYRGQIEEILAQQQMDRLLEQWLAQLRRSTKIEIWPE
jgi:hypothetical protein